MSEEKKKPTEVLTERELAEAESYVRDGLGTFAATALDAIVADNRLLREKLAGAEADNNRWIARFKTLEKRAADAIHILFGRA